MQISFVQEMIPFINSIIRTPNLEIIKYILWRDWFDNYMNISVNLPPYKKKKKTQYYAVVRFWVRTQ